MNLDSMVLLIGSPLTHIVWKRTGSFFGNVSETELFVKVESVKFTTKFYAEKMRSIVTGGSQRYPKRTSTWQWCPATGVRNPVSVGLGSTRRPHCVADGSNKGSCTSDTSVLWF
jgi:hypothetical protein